MVHVLRPSDSEPLLFTKTMSYRFDKKTSTYVLTNTAAKGMRFLEPPKQNTRKCHLIGNNFQVDISFPKTFKRTLPLSFRSGKRNLRLKLTQLQGEKSKTYFVNTTQNKEIILDIQEHYFEIFIYFDKSSWKACISMSQDGWFQMPTPCFISYYEDVSSEQEEEPDTVEDLSLAQDDMAWIEDLQYEPELMDWEDIRHMQW